MTSPKSLGLLALLAVAKVATASTVVPAGTEVVLRFEQSLSSRTAKVGDSVRFTVVHNVVADGKTVIAAGTHVHGLIVAVSHNDHFGKNARIRLAIDPVHGIPLEPRDKGKQFQGSRTDHAAIASGAGALVFGPVGLVGGYFFTGKSVSVKPGDHLRTEVSATTRV